MCGRYQRKSDKQKIADAFHHDGPSRDSLLLAPNDDIRPTTFQPLIRADEEGKPAIELARWGFVPFWQKGDKFPPTTLTLERKGLRRHPCGVTR